MVDESDLPTVTTSVCYKFNVYDDRMTPYYFLSGDTINTLTTLSDVTPNTNKITLTVYEDTLGNPIQSFNQIPLATTQDWLFNVADIVWGENDPTEAYARIWITEGGHGTKPYIVDYNLDQILDIAATGTTTTTTSSTSTTTTSA